MSYLASSLNSGIDYGLLMLIDVFDVPLMYVYSCAEGIPVAEPFGEARCWMLDVGCRICNVVPNRSPLIGRGAFLGNGIPSSAGLSASRSAFYLLRSTLHAL